MLVCSNSSGLTSFLQYCINHLREEQSRRLRLCGHIERRQAQVKRLVRRPAYYPVHFHRQRDQNGAIFAFELDGIGVCGKLRRTQDAGPVDPAGGDHAYGSPCICSTAFPQHDETAPICQRYSRGLRSMNSAVFVAPPISCLYFVSTRT